MFIVSIFIIVPKQKHHKCSSIVGQIKRQWYILTTVEKKPTPIYSATWIILKNIMLSARSKTQENRYYKILFI